MNSPINRRIVVYTALAAFSVQAVAAPPANDTQPKPKSHRHTTPAEEADFEIPKLPSAPPSLILAAPPDPFRCHRKFVYQGKTLDCDNNVRRDGENLRPIIKDVPEAVSELNAYQRTRKNLRYAAYSASAGLVLALVGYFGTRGPNGFRNGDMTLTPMALVALSGLTFSAGSFIYGFALYQSNESRLSDTVNKYNLARPNSPIELEFKTGINF